MCYRDPWLSRLPWESTNFWGSCLAFWVTSAFLQSHPSEYWPAWPSGGNCRKAHQEMAPDSVQDRWQAKLGWAKVHLQNADNTRDRGNIYKNIIIFRCQIRLPWLSDFIKWYSKAHCSYYWWEMSTKNWFSTQTDLGWAGMKHLLSWAPLKRRTRKSFHTVNQTVVKKWSHAKLCWRRGYVVASWAQDLGWEGREKHLSSHPPPFSAAGGRAKGSSQEFPSHWCEGNVLLQN